MISPKILKDTELIDDIIDHVRWASHDPGCNYEFGYRCRCGLALIKEKIQKYE